ncbi:1-acyl-sn-glycerol-3-phosphate acyltransferase [Candidatus Woesearchaeota archaeon]|nr:1-acyl-sn-glycerol-3-phosphate acyltransferase [Candidatus Woesearchaeota archaeon]
MKDVRIFEPKKKEWAYNMVRRLTSLILWTFCRTDYKCMENLEGLEEKGFLLLPRHSSAIDIPLEAAFLHEALGRQAYYIMKSSLPSILSYVGGISLKRTKDFKKEKDVNWRKKSLMEKRHVDNAMAFLLDKGEIIVSHPDGGRQSTFNPHPGFCPRYVKLRTEKDPIFVPLAIDYKHKLLFHAQATLTPGPPIQTRDAKHLEDHLRTYVW